jgi:hypothetical protein
MIHADGNGAEPASSGATAHDEAGRLFEAAARAGVQAAEIGAHVFTLIEVYRDRARATARRKIVQISVGALAFAGVATAVVVASARLVAGIAAAMTVVCGGRAWAGELLGGALALAAVAASIALCLRISSWRRLRSAEAKYAERRRRHEERFGEAEHDEPAAK